MKILVVEDDRDLNEAICAFLSRQDYEVASETAGFDAIERLSNEKFDLVVSDFFMPRGSGKELLKYLRDNKQGWPKFIMITGQASASKSEIIALGADDCLIKPFSFYGFLEIVKGYESLGKAI